MLIPETVTMPPKSMTTVAASPSRTEATDPTSVFSEGEAAIPKVARSSRAPSGSATRVSTSSAASSGTR